MHIEVVNYLAGMEISTIMIANVDMLCGRFYDPSCDMTKSTLIVAIDRERRCVFAMNISVELEWPLCFTEALRTSNVFGFKG